jgi:hypothetical protein
MNALKNYSNASNASNPKINLAKTVVFSLGGNPQPVWEAMVADFRWHGMIKETLTRGLRQGDPLSALVFNIAFEPLLRKILANPKIPGFPIHSIVRKPSRYNGAGAMFPDALPIKLVAYADDLLVLLSKPAEWAPLLENLHTYSKSSNAKVNLRKTEGFPLAGVPQDEWHVFIKKANRKWHDSTSTESLTYLGYPV